MCGEGGGVLCEEGGDEGVGDVEGKDGCGSEEGRCWKLKKGRRGFA